jgi:hypothetical protein
MCSRGESDRPEQGLVWFDDLTKCCTYLPSVWNFLAGGALADETPEGADGRRSVRARMAAGGAVTPLGLGRSPRYAMLYLAGRDAFGKTRSMRCPHHLDDGRCGIWRHREATCSTWFCKHEAGQFGLTFWRRFHDLMYQLELAVARHVVLTLDIGPAALTALFPEPTNEPVRLTAAQMDERDDPSVRERLWGRWLGREEAFYLEAARLVAALDWPEVAAIGGSELTLHASLLRTAQAELLTPSMPDRLMMGPLKVFPQSDGGWRVEGYAASDPLVLSADVVTLLGYFDGRPTREAIAAAEAALDVEVEPALVEKLHAFGVLRPA